MPCLTAIQQFPQLLRRHVVPNGIAGRAIDLPLLLVPFVFADPEGDRPAPLSAFPFRRLSRRARRAHRFHIRLADVLLAEPPILTPESRVVDMLLVATVNELLAHNAGQFGGNVL